MIFAVPVALTIGICTAGDGSVRPWLATGASTGYTSDVRGDPPTLGATLVLRSVGPTWTGPGELVATYTAVEHRRGDVVLQGTVKSATAGSGVCARFEDASGRRTASGIIGLASPIQTVKDKFRIVLQVPEWAVVLRVGVQTRPGGSIEVMDFSVGAAGRRIDTFLDHSRLSASVDAALASHAPVKVVIDSLAAAEARFLETWQATASSLLVSGRGGAPPPLEPDSTVLLPGRGRSRALTASTVQHCHEASPDITHPEQQFLIKSDAGKHAVCPTWLLPSSGALTIDEAHVPDGYVVPRFAEYERAERQTIIVDLDRAAERFRDNEWIEGQRVRFRVDQRDTAGAVSIAARCAASQVWCGLLRGYVTHWRGDLLASDSIFAATMKHAPLEERCRWGDVSILLRYEDWKEYHAAACARRDSIHDVLWWLADPLFTQPGNARRAEHYFRQVTVALRSVLETDGPYDWDPGHGGDAIRQLFVRYGLPTRRAPIDGAGERSHQGYLKSDHPLHFSTNEYTPARVHTVPAWEAVLDPLHSRADDWELTAGAALRPQIWSSWWPDEHFVSGTAKPDLVQLVPLQSAAFRRDTAVVLAIASVVADPVKPTGRLEGDVVLSPSPGTFENYPVVLDDARTTLFREVPPHTAVAGIEIRDPARARTLRARFGFTPSGTLATVDSAHPALSDLAFLVPGGISAADFPSVVAAMQPASDVQFGARVGIYWETYGFAPSTKVDVELTIRLVEEPPGRLRRLARTLGLSKAKAVSHTTHWSKALDAGAIHIPDTRVPAIGQSTVLDTRNLEPGDYVVTMSVRGPGGQVASSSRAFTIRQSVPR